MLYINEIDETIGAAYAAQENEYEGLDSTFLDSWDKDIFAIDEDEPDTAYITKCLEGV